MSHDFDDELERSTERRSRRNPRMREMGAEESASGSNGRYANERERWERHQKRRQEEAERELNVMGDSRIHAIPKRPKREIEFESQQSRRTRQPDMLDELEMGNRRDVRRRSQSQSVSYDLAATAETERQERAQERQQAASRVSEPSAKTGSRKRSGEKGDSPKGPNRSDRVPSKREAKKKRFRRIIAMIVAECIALVAIFSYAFMNRMMSQIQRSEEFQIEEIRTNDIAVDAEENMKGYWTIAIFGVDARDNAIEKSTNSDVIILCNINRDTGEIKLVSVYRDSYLNINEKGSYAKINQAYFVGGPKQAVEALNRNLDLQIQDYMTFNWKAVANAIDVLGGVDIELSKAEFYYINSFITETVKATGIGSHQLTHAGMNHLDGVQAVAYGRLRLMDTDYARTERQRKVIAQAFEKAKKADFQTLYVLIGTVFPQVSTSVWVDDLVSNAKNISKFHLGETTGFPQARGDANMGKKGAVVVPATLESNVIQLHNFLFGDEEYTPSETVKKISAKISSDTGIYKEGQFVGNVGTGGGVVQPPKTTAAATKSSEKSKEEEGYQTVYEYDKNGKKVSKKVKMETDADGKYVKYETDAEGVLKKEETISSSHSATTVAETDENGKIKESHKTSETPTSESSIADTKVSDRPGSSSESTAALHPGSTTPTTAASHPGNTSTSPTSAASHPGSTPTETTASGSGSTAPTAASHPGSTTPTTAASHPGNTSNSPISANPGSTSPGSVNPGNTSSGNTSSVGPSGMGNSSSSVMSGTVSAPGQ